jgi:hypothetical protein
MTDEIYVVDYIASEKVTQFTELLHIYGARWLTNPYERPDGMIRVNYAVPGKAYREFSATWLRITTPIREVRHDQAWRTFLRRLGLTRFV